ncbi:MAG: hypothetical protein V1899_02915 [Planctomycetota bacterium]
MNIQIKNGSGVVIFETEADSQRDAIVKAIASSADLSSADLSSANLSYAIGIIPELVCDLLILKDQLGSMVSYKLTNQRDEGIFNGGLIYADNAELLVADANTDPNQTCASGINVGTLAWVLKNYEPSHRVKVIHHIASDIACIPTTTDGKYRLSRCHVGTCEENSEITARVATLYGLMHSKD